MNNPNHRPYEYSPTGWEIIAGLALLAGMIGFIALIAGAAWRIIFGA